MASGASGCGKGSTQRDSGSSSNSILKPTRTSSSTSTNTSTSTVKEESKNTKPEPRHCLSHTNVSRLESKDFDTIASLSHALTKIEERCVGCLLTSMIGDILGAAVEGMGPADIAKACQSKPNDNGEVTHFVSAKHMGLNHLAPRLGMYTDDTMCTLGKNIVTEFMQTCRC